MMLIFDYFETIAFTKTMDFNCGLKFMWEKYYKDKCSFEEIAAYGEELFGKMQELHKQGLEYAFVKDELPEYAKEYGGDAINMTVEEEAEFLMQCNEMENMSNIEIYLPLARRINNQKLTDELNDLALKYNV